MVLNANKGDWVQIHQIVFTPEERTGKLPEDTKKVPLELWVKGYANHEAKLGENVEITTLTGRVLTGELTIINPTYDYGFGEEFVEELLTIGKSLRKILKEGESIE